MILAYYGTKQCHTIVGLRAKMLFGGRILWIKLGIVLKTLTKTINIFYTEQIGSVYFIILTLGMRVQYEQLRNIIKKRKV